VAESLFGKETTMTILLLCVFLSSTPLEKTLDAICQVESGGRDVVGDGGLAVGPYQIHRAYWQDGTRFLGVTWPYSDARNPDKARRVVRAYLLHYSRKLPQTPQTWARIHNGGPKGPQKAATIVYWKKVQKAME
jgi:hypothetical protein